MRSIWRFLWRVRPFVGGAITLVYPAYASVGAIESQFQEDAQLWLAYWALYSFMTFLEQVFSFCWPVLGVMKFGACCWLLVPRLARSRFVYEEYIRRRFFGVDEFNEKQDSEEVLLGMMKSSTQEALLRFIEENGQGSFEKLMRVATKNVKRPKTPRSTITVYFNRT